MEKHGEIRPGLTPPEAGPAVPIKTAAAPSHALDHALTRLAARTADRLAAPRDRDRDREA